MAVYRLSTAAERDIVQLLAYAGANFGEIARRRYQRLLATALRNIAADPERLCTVIRTELGNGVRSYHLRHSRDHARGEHGIVQRPRHLLLYRAGPGVIGVGRILHDAIELERHLPANYGDD
jgi:toxin ParE1/3/4